MYCACLLSVTHSSQIPVANSSADLAIQWENVSTGSCPNVSAGSCPLATQATSNSVKIQTLQNTISSLVTVVADIQGQVSTLSVPVVSPPAKSHCASVGSMSPSVSSRSQLLVPPSTGSFVSTG